MRAALSPAVSYAIGASLDVSMLRMMPWNTSAVATSAWSSTGLIVMAGGLLRCSLVICFTPPWMRLIVKHGRRSASRCRRSSGSHCSLASNFWSSIWRLRSGVSASAMMRKRLRAFCRNLSRSRLLRFFSSGCRGGAFGGSLVGTSATQQLLEGPARRLARPAADPHVARRADEDLDRPPVLARHVGRRVHRADPHLALEVGVDAAGAAGERGER